MRPSMRFLRHDGIYRSDVVSKPTRVQDSLVIKGLNRPATVESSAKNKSIKQEVQP